MKNPFITVLSWLLYHANRKPSKEFYEIKNRILARYGEHICFDVQHFDAIKCDTCHGTGKFKCFWKLPEMCWSCGGTGWYKPESWVILDRIRFGKYDCFHKPMKRVFKKPEFSNPMIESYVEKTKTKWSKFALAVLFLIYEKGYLKRWYRQTGCGWRCYWWQPRNWVPNIIHFIKHGRHSIPIQRMRDGFVRRYIDPMNHCVVEDDLPF